jgi:hypothetical protein
MKLLIMILISLSANAFAQIEFDVETTTFQSLTSVENMKCVTPISHGESYTELEHGFRKGFDSIELDHKEATVTGCDMEALKELVDRSHNRFGFASVSVTVNKLIAKFPRVINGKCQRYYKEQLKLDLGDGIVLTTRFVGTTKPATGCE